MVLMGWLYFIVVVTTCIYIVAIKEGFYWVVRRWMSPSAPPVTKSGMFQRLERRIRQACVMLAILGLFVAFYAWKIEPYWPQVETVRIASAKLPPGMRPIRIVQISDTHCDPEARLEQRLPEIIAGLRPDVIAFTGDTVNHDEGLSHFRRLMSELSRIAPTFAVKGNWDVRWFDHLDHFNGTGIRVLDGDVATVQVGTVEIDFRGVAVDSPRKLFSQPPADGPARLCVVLHHFPEVAHGAIRQGADLALSGDTHGGQIRLPFVGALARISRFGVCHEIGLHRVENGYLYVNCGVGMEGGHAPRMRFLCRPEVALIEIVPATGAAGRDERP